MNRRSPTRPPNPAHRSLVIPLDHLILVFYPTEPLPLREMCQRNESTRWTIPSAGLPAAVREQRHVIDNIITPTNESTEADYDQILDLIESYT